MADVKKVTAVYTGKVDFVDLYNQAVLTVARRPKKKRVVAKKAILTTTPRDDTDTITAYTALKQSEGQGITVSDVLALLNEPTTHEAIYGNTDLNYTIQASYFRVDANIVMSRLAKRLEAARTAGMPVPLILTEDYFGAIAEFVAKILEDIKVEKRELW
jgi:hypothetical protein